MTHKVIFYIVFVAINFFIGIVITPPIYAQTMIAAFPGAEGYGKWAKGGRGGRVIEVTNLNDSGPGSFREACQSSGARTVVFRVGGIINATSRIDVSNPYITIAGQTAPGDGICIKGAGLMIKTHNVIVRGLRIRPGDSSVGPNPTIRDCLEILGPNGHDVIVDHCSISWGVDENSSTWYSGVNNLTFQWNIISEGLYNSIHPNGKHSMGLLIGDYAQNVSVHHNLFAHDAYRNPYMKGGTKSEIVNNLIYNWGEYEAIKIYDDYNAGASFAHIIGNYMKRGPNSSTMSIKGQAAAAGSRFYVKGNMGPGRPKDEGNELSIVVGSTGFFTTDPIFTPSDIVVQPVMEIYEPILRNAGALWPTRDSVDERVVGEVRNRTGKLINSQSEVGGWPNYRNGSPAMDSDHDGMPDEWERSFGFNPNDLSDSKLDADADGYTNVEEFLNGTLPSLSSSPTPTPAPELTHTIQLQENWNLISLPINPKDDDIAAVLAPINSQYAAVHAFNGKEYESYYHDSASASTLKKIVAGRGYWIYMNQATSLQIKGVIANKSINLSKEWNLVGYNTTTPGEATQALASTNGKVVIVYSYDISSNSYKIVDTFQPGQGYWIYASENVIWTLP
jgi:pectate lyase